MRDLNFENIKNMLEAEDFADVYAEADAVRFLEKGDDVFIRAIIEFSNYCRRRCLYCGVNAGQKNVHRYRMSEEEIVKTAKAAAEAGYRTIVLQSGEDEYFTKNGGEVLGQIIAGIKGIDKDLAITLSCGEMPRETLKHLKECGANRYLLRHETADAKLYAKFHPCGSLEDRLACLRDIKSLGYETGSGFMVGLPGASTATTARDLLLLQELRCDMAGMGPYISHPDTPLGNNPNGSTELTKRALAIARLLLPRANLPVTTAVGVISKQERSDAFGCGANVIMKKVTPDEYKKDYQIYPAKLEDTNIVKDRKNLEEMIRALGRNPV